MLFLCTEENCLPGLRLGLIDKLEYCIVIQILAVVSIIFAQTHPASISNLGNSLGYVCWTSFLVSCFCFSSVSAKLDILWLLAECFSLSAVPMQYIIWLCFFNSNHALEYPIDCNGRKPISGVMKTRGLTRNSWKVPRSPLKRAHKLTTRNHFKLIENCCKCKKIGKKEVHEFSVWDWARYICFLLGSPLRPALLLGFVVLMLQTVATHLVYYDKMLVVST